MILLTFAILIASLLLLISNNKIHCILYLIFIYMCSSIIFMYLGVAIVGLFYFLVYIGAVAVLFLFSIMILNLKEHVSEMDYFHFFSLVFLSLIFFVHFYLIFNDSYFGVYLNSYEYYYGPGDFLKLLGILILKNYDFVLTLAGLVLLVSILGAIHITSVKEGSFTKEQNNPLIRTSNIYYVNIY